MAFLMFQKSVLQLIFATVPKVLKVQLVLMVEGSWYEWNKARPDGARPYGTNGTDALNALVSSSPEASGNNCANGGTRIDVGVDDNADGVLDTTEIDQTQYVCNGGSSNNTMLTSISSPLSNMGCDAGGRTVSYGFDNGDGGGTYANGVLEPGEVDASTTLCSRYSTVLFRDINTGSGNGYFESGFGQNNMRTRSLIAVGNTLFMAANDGTNGFELWKSDGTASGTVMVKDINSGTGEQSSSRPSHSRWQHPLFRSQRRNQRNELWKSDGTASGTVMVKDINSGSGSSSPYYLTAVGNTLYFQPRRNQRIRIVEERWNSQWHSDGQGHQQRKWQQLSLRTHSRWQHPLFPATTEPTDTNCGRATEQPQAQ